MLLFIVFLCYLFNVCGICGHVFAFIPYTGNLYLPSLIALWFRIWSILVNVLCTIGKKVYFSFLRLYGFYTSIRSIWLIELINSLRFLLIFYLFLLPNIERGVLRFPLNIVDLSVSLFSVLSYFAFYTLKLCH